ncbi:unnamed protein product [Rotaria sordida]|uniref:Uncharacterized protein n=1 Tax=Rotaria sordida TaxID=392033 RepID=A0A819CWZ7_9BILA|nr:unnamed protein product [Rotaria sordida]CAF3827214.1 unnamed protein product [Rotaria sordida]
MSSIHPNNSSNLFLTPSATTNRHFLDVDPRRLSIINAANMTSAGVSIHQRRTSIVNYYQRRNSQLRKASFTTSTLPETNEPNRIMIDEKRFSYLRHCSCY